MRLKTFFGPNIPEVMAQVRSELGENVLIVSSHRLGPDTVKLVIAIEDTAAENDLKHALHPTTTEHTETPVYTLLEQHHVPTDDIGEILSFSPKGSLTTVLTKAFLFEPLTADKTPRCFMMVGPAGSGKTIATIKLALESKLKRFTPCVMTLDTVKAGATEQLASFCTLANIPLVRHSDVLTLNDALNEARTKYDFIVIDTMAANYLNADEMNFLKHVKLQTAGVESILTLPAGLDASESIDIAETFARAGCNRFIPTKCDTTKYLGNILAAAFRTRLPFCAFGTNGLISEPFENATPQLLTTLLNSKSVGGPV